MPISWNEIRSRAYTFVNEWKDETRERAEAQSFWNEFLNIYGVHRRRVATFEQAIQKLSGNTGFIDMFWPGTLMVEHKSRGEDLDAAYSQASGYFAQLADAELPKFVLVSDFDRFRLYDMDDGGREVTTFTLAELPDNLTHFGFIAGYETTEVRPEDPVNVQAAEKMGRLHDKLEEAGYEGHALQVYLVRLLFCLFAEDTGIFNRNLFKDLIINFTSVDGSDLGPILGQLFQTLNTAREKRMRNLADHFNDFEYVNGALFEENLPSASFDSEMRDMLLDATTLNWSKISPAIFGSLFQSVMNPDQRRNLGAHYTSETNILKVIEPLFMDGLRQEFERAKGNSRALERFHDKLASLNFLDPACGCGNFLVIAYRELRLLELEVLQEIYSGGQLALDVSNLIRVNVDQFYGIEIEEFPAQIAQVAMWLTDHQMNLKVSEAFGQYFVRLPLEKSATIVNGNALQIDWETVVSKNHLDYILGNPPFVGSKMQDQAQRVDMQRIAGKLNGWGILDFVTGWYFLAAEYIQGTTIEVAFVSTNSISQGEQVGVLWPYLHDERGLKLNFAHRTFQWSNQARGVAAVHCVIIGFALTDRRKKSLFEYDTPKSEPTELTVATINPYLVDGPFVAITNRSNPISNVPSIGIGNKPIDGGFYLFTPEEKAAFLAEEPMAEIYFRRWVGSQEFLQSIERWCLWLGDVPPNDLRKLPKALERVEAVRKYRLDSESAPTNKLAATPTRFHVENMPESEFLIIPEVSSERRTYIPIGFVAPEIMASNLVKISSEATPYHFGVLSSAMHMTWVRYVAGRLKSDYRYSVKLVYNNYPWPQGPSAANVKRVEEAAEAVLSARAKYSDSSLADLYDPLTMPPNLSKAHQILDRAVDLCYRPQAFTTELNRMEFLFELYKQITAPLVNPVKKKR